MIYLTNRLKSESTCPDQDPPVTTYLPIVSSHTYSGFCQSTKGQSMKIFRKFIKRSITVAIAGTLLFSSSVFAQEFNWKFNNGLPENRNESKELDRFASDVSSATNKMLQIKVYHGGSLGLKNEDVLRWLPTGAAEMGLVWANYLGRDAPAMNAVYIQGSVG